MADEEQSGTVGTVTETAPGFVPTTGEAETVESAIGEDDELDYEDGGEVEPPAPPTDGLSLPGVDAWSVVGFVAALIGLFGSWFGTVFSEAGQSRNYIQLQNVGSSATKDQYSTYYNKAIQDQALVHLSFALAGLVLTAIVLLFWRSDRHARWSRAIAQGGFFLSLAGVVIAVLVLTNTVANISF